MPVLHFFRKSGYGFTLFNVKLSGFESKWSSMCFTYLQCTEFPLSHLDNCNSQSTFLFLVD